jgi:hypothetical protein
MRFSLKSLMVGVTLASIYLGAIAFLVRLSRETQIPFSIKMVLGVITLFVTYCLHISLFEAFICRRTGRIKEVAIFGAVATVIAIFAVCLILFSGLR